LHISVFSGIGFTKALGRQKAAKTRSFRQQPMRFSKFLVVEFEVTAMIWVIKKRQILTALALLTLTVALSAACAFGGVVEAVSGKKRKLPVYGVETDEKVVALTFDATWGADKTAGIVKTLNDFGADATFFLVGFWIDAFPKETVMIRENGFEIGNHSDHHLEMSKLSAEKIEEEILSVNRRIEELTGCTPKFFRPPFGDYNDRLINTVSSMGLYTIQWDVDSLDWKDLSKEKITERGLKKVKNGSIILCHNNGMHTLEALPGIFEVLISQGYTFVPIGELIYKQGYFVDALGTQRKK